MLLNIGWRQYGLVLLWISMLLAACGTPHIPTAPACVVVPGDAPGAFAQETALRVDQAASPAYCADAQIRQDYTDSLTWYQTQAEQAQKLRVYPSTMLDEFGYYYTGDLLHTAREQLYYNRQAGRVVIGRWAEIHALDGVSWAADGRSVMLSVIVRGYEVVSFHGHDRDDTSEQSEQVIPGRTFERWQVTLVYDTTDQRWKIQQAGSLMDF